MGYKFNPFTGNFDTTDSPNGVFDSVEVDGDITLDDGGTYATTLQLITPTANRTISFPDATGTVGLVAGSSGQLVYNNTGAYAGAPSTSVGATGNIALSLAGAASTPPVSLTGSWFSGGTSTTTKPQLLIEPVGTTSTAWSTNGTGLGVNAASAFTGRLFDFQVNGSSKAVLDSSGRLGLGTSSPTSTLHVDKDTGSTPTVYINNSGGDAGDGVALKVQASQRGATIGDASVFSVHNNASEIFTVRNDGKVGVGTTSPATTLDVNGDVTITDKIIHGGDTNTAIRFPAADTVSVETGGSERARIDSSGRLLVGTSATSNTNLRAIFQGTPTAPTGTGYVHLSMGRNNPTSGQELGAVAFSDNGHSASAKVAAICDGGWTTETDQPSALVFSVTADGASSPTEALRISNDRSITVSDGGNIVVGTTTGTKIGTATSQKIGFFDATPVVQPTTGVAEAAFVENSGGTAVNVDSTFGGYTLQQVVQALQNLGILA